MGLRHWKRLEADEHKVRIVRGTAHLAAALVVESQTGALSGRPRGVPERAPIRAITLVCA